MSPFGVPISALGGQPPSAPLPPYTQTRRTLGPGAVAGIGAGLLLLLLLGGVVAVASGSTSSSHQVSGTETIYDYSSYGYRSNGSSCSASYGYSDLTSTNAVTVTDGAGDSEYTTLYGGTVSGSGCVFHFELEVADSDSYSVRIGHRNTLSYSRSELQADDWSLSLTIGDDD